MGGTRLCYRSWLRAAARVVELARLATRRGGRMGLVGLVARLGLAALLGLAGCLYDSAERCDENQRYDEAREICVCAENAVALPSGCVTCPEGTVVMNNSCVAP